MINIPKFFKQDESEKSIVTLPLLPLRDLVVFPHMVAPLFVGRTKSVNALADAMNKDKTVFLAAQSSPGIDNPKEKDIHTVGTIASVMQLLRLPDGTVKALVEGKARARVSKFIPDENFFRVELEEYPDDVMDIPMGEAYIRNVMEGFKAYAARNKKITRDILEKAAAITDPSQLVDTISSAMAFKLSDKQRLLETTPLPLRLELLQDLIGHEIEIFNMGQKIKGRVKSQIDKTQKNYYLHEQMRAIKKEMGPEDASDDMEELEKRIESKEMSEEANKKAKQEFNKLKMMQPMSSEATVVRNYIDWMLDLPWFEKSEMRDDLEEAENILDQDHYGLDKPKERIVEYLAVQILIKKIRGPILCLVGPPGVGKTSIAKSVARATGRNFIRLSLGGVRDEAEIRGHRRTYVGALPGKIIQSLKKAGVNNPVFCLDEIDKMSTDFRGDPSSALLEVLDPEQNDSFNDHYLDVDYDLSDIMFITTANTLSDIPLPLQDRMETIRIAGYTEHEKLKIATKFLIPKQVKLNGLEERDITFSKNSVLTVIRHYTREAGVRNLEREISAICRKTARQIVKNGKHGKNDKKPVYKITSSSILKYLGQHKFRHGQVEQNDQIGIVTGLAWTSTGGELLCIETVTMPGKGNLTVTGKLGEVMQESAKAAVSYVRSRSKQLSHLEEDFYKNLDIHIHVPEGAIPKDGPSAGVAMCTAIVSALTKRPVYHDIAMTGEITLRGRVLPIGGLKEKILAAHRGGISRVIIPKENEKDLTEIPANILKQVKVIPAEQVDEVLNIALNFEEGGTLFKEN